MFKLHISLIVVNIKFPRATYHTIVPSTEEFYCLSRSRACSSPGVVYIRKANSVEAGKAKKKEKKKKKETTGRKELTE